MRVSKTIPEVRNIVNQHHVSLGAFEYDSKTNRLIVIATIDNLMKGAATQCLQNVNLTLGLNELDGIDVVNGANVIPGSTNFSKNEVCVFICVFIK